MNKPNTIEQALDQARAEVVWGYPRANIERKLAEAGVPPQAVKLTLDQAISERNSEFRKKGILQVLGGAAALVAGIVIFYATMERASVGETGRRGAKASIIAFVVAFFGISLLVKGLFRVYRGGHGEGTITDE